MIVLENLYKSFNTEPVLNGLSLELPRHNTLSILGRSGCGKSTLLKIMAGLETADSGRFMVHEREMLPLPPGKREVVYLSQEPLLFPHMDVFGNLGYGLKIRKQHRSAIRTRVEEMAGKLGLEDHLAKRPHQLSGGQKQRVSFGRALVINPKIMLLDEPFGSLDTQTRSEMQSLFNTIRKEFNITALFVTHDLKEALLVGDKIAMLQEGTLEIFPSVEAFIKAPGSGAADEINFWNQFNL